jgi:acyl-CoA thioester hydrolase
MNAAPDSASAGCFLGQEHHLPIRVYFEDTDFSGVVYHANYLRFMERARSEMLRAAGVDQRAAFDAGEGAYAVSELTIKYLMPARFDDALTVVSTIEQIRAASVLIHQTVMRGEDIMTQASVIAAFLSPSGRPKRQPKAWIDAFKPYIKE